MNRLLTLMLLYMSSLMAIAGEIYGHIVDANNEPLPFANIIVQQGEKTITGGISDLDGAFRVGNIKEGTYTVAFQVVGYKSENKEITIGHGKSAIDMGTIVLHEESEEIAEVAVVAQKQTMKLGIDRKIFNVDQDIASIGGAASDVLENIPSIEVDSEGNISLRGSSSVTVWINGKAQGMTSDNRGDILQQIPAESIDHIEVITNPSSKYSAEGSAGIINIVLKRDRKAGYYGGVKLAVNNEGGGRIGGNINFSSGIIDAYLNVGLGKRVHRNGGWTDRDYLASDGHATGFLNSTTKGKSNGRNIFIRTGLTWHITEKDELSAGYMGMHGSHGRNSSIKYRSENYEPDELISPFVRQRETDSDNDMDMNNVELSYRHEWATGHSLEITGSTGQWKMNGATTYDQSSYALGALAGKDISTDEALKALKETETPQNSFQSQTSNIKNNETNIRADYERPIGEQSKLEVGYEGEFGRENSPTETFADAEHTQSIKSLFNRFKYDSDIHAGYANWNSQVNEVFGYQLGLRGEGWKIRTSSFSYDNEYSGTEPIKFSKSYFELFPTAYLSFHITETNELQLNYTRRLSRPWGGQMNSFKNITDSTSISYGNPLLTPEFTNSLELNYIKTWDNHTLSVSAYYRPSTDVIQHITYMENGTQFSTNENIAKSLSSGVELIGKNRLWNVLDLTSTINVFYYKLEGGTFSKTTDSGNVVPIVVKTDDNFSWNFRELASLILPKEFTWQTTFSFEAPRVITQGKRMASYSWDMGLKKTLLDRKLTLALNCRDLLDSRKTRTKTQSTGFRQESESWRGGRRFFFQIAYNFGNMKSKKPQRENQMQSPTGEGLED